MNNREQNKKLISPFIADQIPAYVSLVHGDPTIEGGCLFARFIQLYYEWLETSYVTTLSDYSERSISAYSDRTILSVNNPNKPEASDLEERIMNLIDSTVNPQIASHGGRIEVVGVEAGILYIEMHGGCQGCSASKYTLQYGVEQQIKSQFPEVKRIDDITNHEEGENPYYQ